MKRTVFKLQSKLKGDRIIETIFVGNEGQTLQNAGQINFHIGEWQLFGALLKLATESNISANQHAVILFDGDEKIINELSNRSCHATEQIYNERYGKNGRSFSNQRKR